MLSSLLLWLDGSPARYLTLAWIVFAATAASALTAGIGDGRPARWNRPWVFAGLLFLAIVAFRWPSLLFNHQMTDPDESQILAGAMTLREDPWFWRSVDGATHGPLVALPLVLASLAGWPLDYTGARLMGVLLTWAALACTWLALRSFHGDGTARVAVLPVLALLAFTRFWGFIEFYGEPITNLLLAAALWLVIAPERRLAPGRLFAGGACLGAVPFAKLQGVPIGLWIGGWALGALLVRRRWRHAGWLFAGAGLVPLIVLLYVGLAGLGSDFWNSYILGNLAYAGEPMFGWATAHRAFMKMGRDAAGFQAFFLPALVNLGLFLLPGPWLRPDERHRIVFALGLVAVALYAILAPRRDFMHYLMLLFFPLAYAVGVAWGNTRAAAPRGGRWAGAIAIVLFLGVGLGPQIVERQRTEEPYLGSYRRTRGALQIGAVAAELKRLAPPGERCAIWGWEPRYYVESGRAQGTRDAATDWAMEGRRVDYYRQRFLDDLERQAPALFADAVGASSWAATDRDRDGHASFAPLGAYVAAHYRLVADIEGTRIYLRADLPQPPLRPVS